MCWSFRLKDASSAAIYGAKAASGVIIISTKKGKSGKPTINVSANLAANTKAQYRKVFSASEYMTYREDWFKATTYGYDAMPRIRLAEWVLSPCWGSGSLRSMTSSLLNPRDLTRMNPSSLGDATAIRSSVTAAASP